MIWSGEVYVYNWNYRKLLQFANSFDYSSQKWDEFYQSRENGSLQIENTNLENVNNNNNNNPAIELLSPRNPLNSPTKTSSNQISTTPRSRNSFTPSKPQLRQLLKTPRVREYVSMISNNKSKDKIQYGRMPGLMINNKNLCCFGTWSLFYNSVPNLLNVERLCKRIEPRLKYSYYDDVYVFLLFIYIIIIYSQLKIFLIQLN